MKFIQKPSPPFEAFQWFKLGDGPEGVVILYPGKHDRKGGCPWCGKPRMDHGHLNNFRVCPGDWIAELGVLGWERFTPAAFEDFCVPVIDVDSLVLEGLEKLGFSGLKSNGGHNVRT